VNYISPINYAQTLNTFKGGNFINEEAEEELEEVEPKKMSEARKKLKVIKQGLSPDKQEQLEEYLDAMEEIKKEIKKLVEEGSHQMQETGGDQMHKWMHETKKKAKK
jgi:phage-related protein